jgi:hypothetical protein
MPIGMPGCPELAFCTASMESARMALTMSALEAAAVGVSGMGKSVAKVRRIRRNPLENASLGGIYAIILAHFFTAIFFYFSLG